MRHAIVMPLRRRNTMPKRIDVAIRGGAIVTAGSVSTADLGIKDGQIVQIGGTMIADAEIDARDKLVLPGGVDMHVHLSPVEFAGASTSWADDFSSGSRAAAVGGVTTIGNITFPRRGERLSHVIERVAADATRDSIVDFVLHPVLFDPSEDAIAEIPQLAQQGHTSLKVFMSIGDFDARANDFLQAMSAAGENGVLTLIHCEDACVISHLTHKLLASGHGDLTNYAASRPIYSEAVRLRMPPSTSFISGVLRRLKQHKEHAVVVCRCTWRHVRSIYTSPTTSLRVQKAHCISAIHHFAADRIWTHSGQA